MIRILKEEVLLVPKAIASTSPEVCKLYISASTLPGEEHSFDALKEVSGLGRNVLRRALKELEGLGFANLDAFRDSNGNFTGKGWRVDKVEVEVEKEAPPTGQMMEMLSTDGYAIKYRSVSELEYKQAVWHEIRKSKEYRALLLELDCSRDVFLDRYLAYAHELNIPVRKNRLEGLLRSHDEYMKQEAKTVSGRVRQTTGDEYADLIDRIWKASNKYAKGYADYNKNDEAKEKEAIRIILHRTDWAWEDFCSYIISVMFFWSEPKPFFWERYVEKGNFLYSKLMDETRENVGEFIRWTTNDNPYLQEEGLRVKKAVLGWYKKHKAHFDATWAKVK